MSILSTNGVRPVRRRTRRDPKPRFKPDVTDQLDAIAGCPALQVPADHLARGVLRIVSSFDLSSIERRYSSLGRHGYTPRSYVAVWIYASLVGIHHATKLARLLETDAAFRLLSGGYSISRQRLNAFRKDNQELYQDLIAQTVAKAREAGLLPLDALAVDSMRLRAHASNKATGTLSRSEQRLKDLEGVDVACLNERERTKHDEKVAKHTRVVEECERQGRTSIVTSNPLAGLIKFPDGASGPGHRLTTVATGAKARIVVAVLVSHDATDFGQLLPAVTATRAMLNRIGVDQNRALQFVGDAGYSAQADLVVAEKLLDESVDILVDTRHSPGLKKQKDHLFDKDRFEVRDDNTVICPAGRPMRGPKIRREVRLEWTGVGCDKCPLRPQCTDAQSRTFSVNRELDRLRQNMNARLATDEGKQRYRRRIATIEPVFSNLESTMGFRRSSSRMANTVVAEVLLKILAHNVSRLLAAGRLSLVYLLLDADDLNLAN